MADSLQPPTAFHRITSTEPLEPIVAGQATNLWSLAYRSALDRPLTDLPEPADLVSRDLDILGGRETFDRLKQKAADWRLESDGPTGGHALHLTPKPGMLDVVGYINLNLRSGGIAVIEVIPKVSGLTDDESRQFTKLEYEGHQYMVLNPVSLYKAKLYNVAHIPQNEPDRERQDIPQLKALHLIVPRFLDDYHRSISQQTPDDIAILAKLLRVLQSAISLAESKTVLRQLHLSPAELVPFAVLNSKFLDVRQAALSVRAAFSAGPRISH